MAADEARMAAGGRESWMLDAPTDKGGSFLDELKRQGGPTKRGFTQMVFMLSYIRCERVGERE